MGGICSTYGDRRGVYRFLLGKPEVKRTLGRPKRRWGNIKMDLQEAGCGGIDWIDLAHDRDSWRLLLNPVMNIWVLDFRLSPYTEYSKLSLG